MNLGHLNKYIQKYKYLHGYNWERIYERLSPNIFREPCNFIIALSSPCALLLDFDLQNFSRVFAICNALSHKFNCAVAIYKTSENSYHAVFDKEFDSFEEVLKLIHEFAREGIIDYKWHRIKHYKCVLTLRISGKSTKPIPKPVALIGNPSINGIIVKWELYKRIVLEGTYPPL